MMRGTKVLAVLALLIVACQMKTLLVKTKSKGNEYFFDKSAHFLPKETLVRNCADFIQHADKVRGFHFMQFSVTNL